MENSKKPSNNNLFFYDETYKIYLVDSADANVILKTIDEGVNVDVVETRSGVGILEAWHDKANSKIYFCEYIDNGGSPEVGAFYLDLTDDSITEIGSISGANDHNGLDIFLIGSDIFILVFYTDGGGTDELHVYKWVDPDWVSQDTLAIGGALNNNIPGVVVGTVYYFVADNSTDNTQVFEYDNSITTIAKNVDVATYRVHGVNYYFMPYDGGDLFYFPATDDGGTTITILSYDKSDDSITVKAVNTVTLMLDRNCIGTSPSPWEFEKGFHRTSPYIYQISRSHKNLVKIQDLGLTGGEIIVAISDKYLITSNSDLYEYTNYLSNLALAKPTYKTHGFPKGRFEYTTSLSTDQLIEIWENDSGTYTLVFRGKLGTPKYTIRKGKPFYQYKCNNFGFDDLNQKISYTATAEGIDEVVIALIGQLTSPYIYCDATSVPNIAVNMTYTFDNVRLRDALYICCILGNAYWWFEPNGYFYFRTWAGKPKSEWYYGSPDNFNLETVGTAGTNIAFVDSATLHDGALEIVNNWQNHKNVLRLLDDVTGGEDPTFTHNITAAMDGTVEFYIGSNNTGPTDPQWFTFGLYDSDATEYVVLLRIENDDLDYLDDGDAWQEIQAVADNTLYHIKITWVNAGTDTFSVWVDDVLKVDGENCNNDQTAGVDGFIVTGLSDSVDYLYIDAWGNVADSNYTVGDNNNECFKQYTNNMGPQKAVITKIQYNSYNNVRGGWDAANNTEFTPTTPTVVAHVQQYGPLEWNGRKSFAGAITQASLDAIITGLKAWQGIDENPVDAEGFITGKYYYKIGYYASHQYSGRTEFATATDRLIIKNETDFKRPGKIKITFSTNLVRKS